jgi:hypothetical protein
MTAFRKEWIVPHLFFLFEFAPLAPPSASVSLRRVRLG